MNEVDGQGHIFVRPFSELDRSISYGRMQSAREH